MPDAAPAVHAAPPPPDAAARRILCVVVTFNRREVVLRCVDRLLRRVVVPHGYRLEVLVVDNDSADGTREAVRSCFPAVRVANTGGNLGGSGAFRLGMRRAVEEGFDLVWLHDNDAFPSRRILPHYLAALERLGGEAIVGGSMHQLEAPRRLNEAGGYFGRSRNLDIQLPLLGKRSTARLRRSAEPLAVDYVAFANAIMPVSLVRRIGLPEDLFLHYDDIEYCLRARAAGFPVAAAPAAVFWHESWLAKPKTWMQYYDTRNSLWTVALRMPAKLPLRRAIWMASAAKNLIAGRPALAAAILDGVRDQARGVTGRVALDAGGFAAHDTGAQGLDALLAAHGCRSLAVDWDSLQALPPTYRAPWLARLAALGDRAFLCRVAGVRFTLHPAQGSGAAGRRAESPPAAPLRRAAARRAAAESLLVRSALRTGPRARLALRAFRRVLWLHGAHVVDHGVGADRRATLRLAARWVVEWRALLAGSAARRAAAEGDGR